MPMIWMFVNCSQFVIVRSWAPLYAYLLHSSVTRTLSHGCKLFLYFCLKLNLISVWNVFYFYSFYCTCIFLFNFMTVRLSCYSSILSVCLFVCLPVSLYANNFAPIDRLSVLHSWFLLYCNLYFIFRGRCVR